MVILTFKGKHPITSNPPDRKPLCRGSVITTGSAQMILCPRLFILRTKIAFLHAEKNVCSRPHQIRKLVMGIGVRKHQQHNKARIHELSSESSMDRALLLLCQTAKRSMTMTIYITFPAACKFFSEHAIRKVIWPLDKQEGVMNMR